MYSILGREAYEHNSTNRTSAHALAAKERVQPRHTIFPHLYRTRVIKRMDVVFSMYHLWFRLFLWLGHRSLLFVRCFLCSDHQTSGQTKTTLSSSQCSPCTRACSRSMVIPLWTHSNCIFCCRYALVYWTCLVLALHALRSHRWVFSNLSGGSLPERCVRWGDTGYSLWLYLWLYLVAILHSFKT